jgi:hypothetical protein
MLVHRVILELRANKAVVAWIETTIPLVTPQDRSCWGVLILHDLLDDTQCDMLKSVYQALGVPMQRMSYHVVDFLAQNSGALFQRER